MSNDMTMKHALRQVAQTVKRGASVVQDWYDPPLGADAKPLEIRQAIVDDIEHHAEPAGAGRRVLPHNQVTVVILAPGKTDRARLQAGLDGLHDAVCARLGEIQCAVPPGFAIDLRFVKHAKPGWAANQRLAIEYGDSDGAEPLPETQEGVPRLRVSIVRGQATHASYTFTETRIAIGRSQAPVDGRGRPRTNHIAFIDSDDEHSRTVGRAHASITYDRARREYRLFDDGSHNGTRVIRDGVTLNVVPRDPVGVAIRSGDEIQVGTAALKVQIERSR